MAGFRTYILTAASPRGIAYGTVFAAFDMTPEQVHNRKI